MISHMMTLANGIIGVSVLAMPFCFKQCGIILATLMLLVSSMLSRLACHFLVKSAVMSRRRNFEFLAFHAFGPMGKFLVELFIIGYLLGTCIAFLVVVGDLGPQIIGEMINKRPEDIRTSFLITTGIFIVLPLGLLRNIDSLASVSTASIAFYICLVFKVMAESTHHIFKIDWVYNVHYWRPAGLLQCVPIFALALFCQTQLFEIYEAMSNATLEKMNQVVRGALNICTVVYICVGYFGYIAFCTQPFTGNILMSFEASMTSEIIKIGFVLSVVFSFPLVIFPCRASLNSLLFRRGYSHETTTSYISETRFRCLTIFIVSISLIIGVLIPSIEFVLGIVGSTIGVIICLIFPAAFFISISTKNTNERLLAQILVVIGIWIMILGTYANLYAMEQSSISRATATTIKVPNQINNMPHIIVHNDLLIRSDEIKQIDVEKEISDKSKPEKIIDKASDSENIRQEPPVPVERLPERLPPVNENPNNKEEKILETITISPKIQAIVDNIKNMDNDLIKQVEGAYDSLQKNKKENEPQVEAALNIEVDKEKEKIANPVPKIDVIAVDAIKKEEIELAADKEIGNVDSEQRREQLKETLAKHISEQKDLMQEQIELLKDIEQKKKEIQLVEKEKEKKSIDTVVDDKNKEQVKKEADVQKPIQETKIEESKNVKKENEIKFQDLKSPEENNVKPVVLENIPKVDTKNSKSEDVKDEVLINIKNKPNENKPLIVEEKPKNVKSNFLDTKINKLKHSEDPIIQVLTKQSNKVSNGNKDDNIPEESVNKAVAVERPKNVEKKEKKDEFLLPIVLKMNNQTKSLPESEHSQINQSNANIVGVKRDILEDHQREKRDVEEVDISKVSSNLPKEFDDISKVSSNLPKEFDSNSKVSTNLPKEENKSDSVNNELKTNEEKVCVKKESEEPTKVKNDKILDTISSEENAANLIKTSAYLSDQDVLKQVSIQPDLTAGANFVKLKKRDLKALSFEDENEK